MGNPYKARARQPQVTIKRPEQRSEMVDVPAVFIWWPNDLVFNDWFTTPEEPETTMAFGELSVREARVWIGGDPVKAQRVLDAELSRPAEEQRRSLIEHANRIVGRGDGG